MDVNDDAFILEKRGVLEFIASVLAPTEDQKKPGQKVGQCVDQTSVSSSGMASNKSATRP
ncbi:hypothetical protein EJA72_16415 [Pseudomonas sp. PB120]|nr:hypothetical protein [Pseudomonas sp. PB120]